MEVYTKILGNSHSAEWTPRLKDAKIDYIELDQWNAQKSRLLAVGGSGKTYAMAFERGVRLSDGDIIAFDDRSHEASIVKFRLGDVLVIDLSGLARHSYSEAIALAIELGHAIGNQHWAALVRGDSLMVPLAVDRKVMLSVMRTYNFDDISFTFRPGSEIVPFLSPSEIRMLFGSSQPQGHARHSHHPHPKVEEYV